MRLQQYLTILIITLVSGFSISVQAEDSQAVSSIDYEKFVTGNGGKVSYVFGDDRPFAECHASTLVQAANGHIVCVWFAGKHEKNPDVGIWISRFDGSVWTKPVELAKVEETAHWNPVLFIDPDNTISLFFKIGLDPRRWRTYWTQSKDNGSSWSDPEKLVIGDAGGRGPVKNKPILLSDGTWLAPASSEDKKGRMVIWKSFSDRSTDKGKTWVRSLDFVVPANGGEKFKGVGCIQPTFWESEPGKVHALVRTGSGYVWRADSSDGGKTWSEMRALDLPNNNSGLDAIKLNDGRVLLVLNPVGKIWGKRTPLDLSISADNGETWRSIAHLEDQPGEYSYPAIVQTKNGIGICYTWKRQRVRYWNIPLELIK